MKNRKFTPNFFARTANPWPGSPAMRLLRRMMILAILMGGLAFLVSDRAVKVQATDCSNAWLGVEMCYYNCSLNTNFSQRLSCYAACQYNHAYAGMTCEMPNHTPMMAPGGCDPSANGLRAYDNCMAGTLAGFWLGEYLNYLAYYDNMEVACLMVAQSVENQGCW